MHAPLIEPRGQIDVLKSKASKQSEMYEAIKERCRVEQAHLETTQLDSCRRFRNDMMIASVAKHTAAKEMLERYCIHSEGFLDIVLTAE